MNFHFARFVAFMKQLALRLACTSSTNDQSSFDFVNQSFLILNRSMKIQHQQIRQQNMNQQEFVTSQLRQIKSRMSDKLSIMKNETNVQLLELKKRMKKRLIEKFITIKKNLVQVKIDIESIKQNIKDDKKMIKKKFIQIKIKAVFDKDELHEKIDDFSIDVKNLVVITRNDKLRRFHEVINRVKIRKSILDFDKFT